MLATSTPKLIAVAAGGADADKVAIGGSVTVNSVANTVTADIDSSTVSSSGNLSVAASESAMEVVVAGAIAIASGAAIGAAVAYNYVGESFDTANPEVAAHGSSTSSCAASISNSTVKVGGNLLVSAGYGPPNPLPSLSSVTIDGKTGFGQTLDMPVTVDTQLVCVAVGASFANTFALGGSVALDYIRQTIHATIDTNSTVNATGSVTVTATDDSSIGMGAGGAGIAKGTNTFGQAATSGLAAIGAAGVYNDIANNLMAEIANSTVTSTGGNIAVLAQEQAAITAVAIGGSFAQNFSLGGSVAIDAIDNSIAADISGSTITGGAVTVTASDTSQITTIAGALSLDVALKSGSAVSAAVGVSVAISSMGSQSNPDSVTAEIDNDSTMNATGNVSVTVTASPSITSYSAAGAYPATSEKADPPWALTVRGLGRATRFTRRCKRSSRVAAPSPPPTAATCS